MRLTYEVLEQELWFQLPSVSVIETIDDFIPAPYQLLFQGRIYQTLDCIVPESTMNKGQRGFLPVPKGFEVAMIRPRVLEEVIQRFPWGCCALVCKEPESVWGDYCAFRTANVIETDKEVFDERPGELWDGHIQLLEREGCLHVGTYPSPSSWNFQRKILISSIC